MTPRAKTIVLVGGLGAAAIAVILSPVPLADELVIGPGLLGIGVIVGLDRGRTWRELPWRSLAATAAAGLGARAALNLAVTSVPGVAAVVNAATAFALTRAYAEWADRACGDAKAGSEARA